MTPAPAGGRPAIGAAEFPVFHEMRREAHAALLPQAILDGEPYPVRGMIVSGTSILTAWPEPSRWRRALAALDLLVTINRFPTADSAYADLVLPATTMFEIESYQEYHGHVELRRRVIEPVGEARNDYLIFAELAARLGYGERWPQTERGMVGARARGHRASRYDELAASPNGVELPAAAAALPQVRDRRAARATAGPASTRPPAASRSPPSGSAATATSRCPSTPSRPRGRSPRPSWRAATRSSSTPGARTKSDFRSQHHNIPSLVAMQPWPLVHLHPADAAARGIADGDEVDVVTPRGRVRFRAHVTEDIVRGAVEANMGGGGPLGPEAWRQRERQRPHGRLELRPDLGLPGLQGAALRGRAGSRRCGLGQALTDAPTRG